MAKSEGNAVFLKARRHLARRDPVLKKLIAKVGDCTLQVNPDGFDVLVRSIVSQQISSKAAKSISARLEQLLGAAGICAEGVLAVPEESLRSVGLSAAKVRSVRDLAEKVRDGLVPLQTLHELADEEVVKSLLPVRGIGRWTAEMFLIFSLGRVDVLPVADFGLREGVRRQYALPEQPNKEKLVELAEPWRPYRSIATWFFWRSFGPVPQSS
jgi:DNA-3-methyladenine glycosylase II